MKTFSYMILAMAFSFSGCSSQKKLVDNPPIETGAATCQQWVGGRAETGSGLLLEIPVTNLNGMVLQQAYFRGKIADLKIKDKDGVAVATANFMNKNPEKPDIISHSDATKEVGNQPPKLQEKFPFELESDQCVLSYMDGDTKKYFKLEGIKEKKPLIYQ